MIPFYDHNAEGWNWPMPSPGNIVLEQATKAATGTNSRGSWGEILVAAFFNAIATAMTPTIAAAETDKKNPLPHHHWLGSCSNCCLAGTADGAGTYDRHSDIILIESANYITQLLSWTSPVIHSCGGCIQH